MTRRRKRPNLFGWTLFGLVILFGYYFNQVYLPSQPNPFEATPTVTRSPESYVSEAGDLFKEGKLPQAIEAYQSAINASPQDPVLYIALARVQVWAGQYEEAQANAENAILLSPESSMAHAVRAWALDFQDGKNGDALEEIQKALDLDDRNALAHAYNVEILVDSNLFDNYAKAAEESKVALGLDPNLLEAHRARGYILSTLGTEGNNYELAIQEYRQAIQLNPKLAVLHIELGQNLRLLQVYEDAIKEFTLANTLNPPDPEPDYLISRTYATQGDYAKALQYAETAVKDNPTDARWRGNYGVMLYRNFDYEKALAQFSLAINGGKNDAGQEVRSLALTNDQRVTEYYFTYGLALAHMNQCGQALKISQQLQTVASGDETVMEAANKIVEICQENLNNPAVDTSTPGAEETPVTETETPAAPTPTP
ncbi:MAG TPA: tetratricopeptide repeat protein [Anaerolineales bacterium]